MLRSIFQAYIKGSAQAVELYKKAFDAQVISQYIHKDGSYMHVELNIYGQTLALAEVLPGTEAGSAGTTMQFCLHFGEGKEELVKKAYEVLKEGAQINIPLSENFFSPLIFGLVDRYGINWCLFI